MISRLVHIALVMTAALACPLVAVAAETLSASKQTARGLAANCAQCHGTNGKSAGGAVPGLAGVDASYFTTQMQQFREGKRPATIMHQIAKGYTEQEVALMAEYFSQQKK